MAHTGNFYQPRIDQNIKFITLCEFYLWQIKFFLNECKKKCRKTNTNGHAIENKERTFHIPKQIFDLFAWITSKNSNI